MSASRKQDPTSPAQLSTVAGSPSAEFPSLDRAAHESSSSSPSHPAGSTETLPSPAAPTAPRSADCHPAWKQQHLILLPATPSTARAQDNTHTAYRQNPVHPQANKTRQAGEPKGITQVTKSFLHPKPTALVGAARSQCTAAQAQDPTAGPGSPVLGSGLYRKHSSQQCG